MNCKDSKHLIGISVFDVGFMRAMFISFVLLKPEVGLVRSACLVQGVSLSYSSLY